ncbi:zinc finger domain-containing protein [Streptomyces rubiginosohelvolus]
MNTQTIPVDPVDTIEAAEDTARRFAGRLAAVEQLCSGRPGYHTVTVKALLTAMGEADDEGQEQPLAAWLTGADAGPPAPLPAADEPPLLDPFTEAAVRRGALLGGADAIEALPQDQECDPGRGDAVKLLRRLAGLTSTTEQPTGLTWEARADHAVRLYATTAIELEDARRENGRLRERLAELEQGQADAAQAAAEQRDNVDFNRGDTVAAVRDALLDMDEHTPETALAASHVLLAAHTRLLAVEARERLTERDAEMRSDGYRGRVAWCSGMREVVKLLAERADALAPETPAPSVETPEQPLAFPQLVVPCPRCEAPAGQLCTSHSGTRQRTNDTHQDRTRAYRATQAGR